MLLLLISLSTPAFSAGVIKCQKEAEEFAINESRRRGNLPKELLSPARPTKARGKYIMVYIGARSGYNYFKLTVDKNCNVLGVMDDKFSK